MTSATVTPLARFPLFSAMGFPVIHANQPFILGTQPGYMTFMPHPDGQGDITWQGGQFGLAAPGGANVTYVAVTVTHRVSTTTAYTKVTGQLYAAGNPVGNPAAFTPSATPVSGTITVYSGISAANLSSLAVQVTFHSAQAGLAYVYKAYATASYSFADAAGTITIAGTTSIPVPVVSVTPAPSVSLRYAGAAVTNYSPSFGGITVAGDLLIGWTFSNSGSGTFDTTCSNPAWMLIGHAGAAFGWYGLWCKPQCGSAESPPAFTSSAATTPMSQLLDFRGAILRLDQTGTYSGGDENFTLSTSSRDTSSGDFVIGGMIWAGANPTPAVITTAGTDSSGAALALTMNSNAATVNQIPYVVAWGQAGSPFAPGVDSIAATISIFDFGEGVIASFTADPIPPPPSRTFFMAAM